MNRIDFEYPTDHIAWSLLNQPVIRATLRETLNTQSFCCLAIARRHHCHDFAHRLIAVFPYLYEIAAFATDELPEGFVTVTAAAKEQSIIET